MRFVLVLLLGVASVLCARLQGSQLNEGQVLTVAPRDSDRFDTKAVAAPRVFFDSRRVLWVMYYYGKSFKFIEKHPDVTPLPTGYVGLAESADGIAWRRLDGPGEGGSVLAPATKKGAWDSAHVGVGDVMLSDDGKSKYTMYYFGGSLNDGLPSPSNASNTICGFPLRIGVATSTDGLNWRRARKPLLELAPSEKGWSGEGWPQFVQLNETTSLLYYHSQANFSAPFVVTAAIHQGKRGKWKRLDYPLLGAGPEGTYYSRGVGTRWVVANPNYNASSPAANLSDAGRALTLSTSQWWMFGESVAPSPNEHTISLFGSRDGFSWGSLYTLPVLMPRIGVKGAADSRFVGTPNAVVRNEGKEVWLYYVAVRQGEAEDPFDVKETPFSIGLAICKIDGDKIDCERVPSPLVPQTE
ncbi:unnamed protein product [Vitrella brassicaformis CCMP3155]|uniref:Glycosyl hydrolase family 32 N-terminal domain-containing protein n=1 Tax=Vitrella brassicaformis (strain CCMP3155) TaxID=1169540 RepID=A0A0G4FHG7_VITBC|nr:unnamed protein product [Vitrella brassicaformis CCMP3155]|eukprot:CEM12870.1 unnamed protein product [Vitrella brassicaformis CCMP3155]